MDNPTSESTSDSSGRPCCFGYTESGEYIFVVPNPATIRDIEYGRDAKLSNIEAVANALGLKLELVEQDG